MIESVLHARLGGVRERIARAAGRAGRDPASITLIAVSKTFPASDVRAAFALGQRDFGENKVQEAFAKAHDTSDLLIRWHLLGHLQSNKVRKAVSLFDIIHSIDDVALVQRIDRAAGEVGRPIDLLIQVDLAGEASKSGVPPDDVRRVVDAALAGIHVRLRGLMLLPPAVDDVEGVRPWFTRLRRLRDALVADGVPAPSLADLSMGMSDDFEVAVEEGATMVRIGTAVFGTRPGPELPD